MMCPTGAPFSRRLKRLAGLLLLFLTGCLPWPTWMGMGF
jgi:hypothetical protein